MWSYLPFSLYSHSVTDSRAAFFPFPSSLRHQIFTKSFAIFSFLVEFRLHEAGYFHAISQSLKFTVQLLQIPEKVVISQIMQQIAELDPDMILLYTSTEIIKSLVQEVK